jgi:23S rRNA (uridine2552-2'-O)-methyltransferase
LVLKASSKRWLRRHVTDHYVKQARGQGYRSRAAFKLIEIVEKDHLLKPGARVLDLGAAPGGWSQVAARKVLPGGRVVAVDLLDIAPISGVTSVRGDFREAAVRAKLIEALGAERADVVLSDISANVTGIANVDQARAAELLRAVVDFCRVLLNPKGVLLVKMFQGEAFADVLAELKGAFIAVQTRKPGASRGESRELYLLARGLRAC